MQFPEFFKAQSFALDAQNSHNALTTLKYRITIYSFLRTKRRRRRYCAHIIGRSHKGAGILIVYQSKLYSQLHDP